MGAQHKALTNLKKQKLINDFKITGTSDWDIYAVQSYAAIHHKDELDKLYRGKKPTVEELRAFFSCYEGSFSKDSNNPIVIKDLWIEKREPWLIDIYYSFKVSNNIGTIIKSGKRLEEVIDEKGIDVLVYSFPCKDLSTAGAFSGMTGGVTEGKRSGLLKEIEKAIAHLDKRDKLPKYLLLENVPNLVWKTHRKDFDKWLRFLSRKGYSTNWSIITSSEYGTFQKRRRVFALSTRKLDGKKPEMKENLTSLIHEKLGDRIIATKEKYSDTIIRPSELPVWEKKVSWIRNTPSRVKATTDKKQLKLGDRGTENQVISTVTTKQDRYPFVGWKDSSPLKPKEGYLNKMFVSPLETYLLMGFEKDSDYKLARKAMIRAKEHNKYRATDTFVVNKLYAQAGNSIIVRVLENIFLYISEIEEKEKIKNDKKNK